MGVLRQYAYNMLMALDQFISAVLGGHPDDTVSQRLGRASLSSPGPGVQFFRRLVDTLAWILVRQKDHCISSLDGKEGVKELWNWGGERK